MHDLRSTPRSTLVAVALSALPLALHACSSSPSAPPRPGQPLAVAGPIERYIDASWAFATPGRLTATAMPAPAGDLRINVSAAPRGQRGQSFGATLDADELFASGTTIHVGVEGADGHFELPVPVHGEPIDLRLRVSAAAPVDALVLRLSLASGHLNASVVHRLPIAIEPDPGAPPIDDLSGRWTLDANAYWDSRHGCFVTGAVLELAQSGSSLTGQTASGSYFCSYNPPAPLAPSPVTGTVHADGRVELLIDLGDGRVWTLSGLAGWGAVDGGVAQPPVSTGDFSMTR